MSTLPALLLDRAGTQGAAANAEESAAAAEELSGQAQMMQGVTAQFIVSGSSKSSASSARPSAARAQPSAARSAVPNRVKGLSKSNGHNRVSTALASQASADPHAAIPFEEF